MLVAATAKGICRLTFDEDEAALQRRFPNAAIQPADDGDGFADLVEGVLAAIERPTAAHDLPIDVHGTAFQEAVWRELRKIPPGETRSYAEIAAAIGQPAAVRAVGTANGANQVAVLVPCHRVIRSRRHARRLCRRARPQAPVARGRRGRVEGTGAAGPLVRILVLFREEFLLVRAKASGPLPASISLSTASASFCLVCPRCGR